MKRIAWHRHFLAASMSIGFGLGLASVAHAAPSDHWYECIPGRDTACEVCSAAPCDLSDPQALCCRPIDSDR